MKQEKAITKRRLKWNFTHLVNIFNGKVAQELIDEEIGNNFKSLLEIIHVTIIKTELDEETSKEYLRIMQDLKKMLKGKPKNEA